MFVGTQAMRAFNCISHMYVHTSVCLLILFITQL